MQNHPFFVAAQFHPEFKSRPGKPTPLFLGFILASANKLNSYLRSRTTPMPSPMSTPTKAMGSSAAAAVSALEAFSLSNGVGSEQQQHKEQQAGAQQALFKG